MYEFEKKVVLSIDDDVCFLSVTEAVNKIFGGQMELFRNRLFVPSVFRQLGLNDIKVWTPFEGDEYQNEMDEKGLVIKEKILERRQSFGTKEDRIALYGKRDSWGVRYKFTGIFRYAGTKDGFAIWKRVSDKIKIHANKIALSKVV